ncbi:hypothetical protein BD309DRAFT_1084333 [Dichomitus squalens]|uniref:Uncharacterized protein n=1 Tax=Dichomitus squalens TaxID=114155 RepID=A0A4Q9Q269_9APHY|nr:hypothetical protein BD309DRAFT_1084333 [Dichomitus squalens]TBU61199.1 hypothetical protein BD310DRAFT_873637 [Dichomitus squalens]
MSDDLIQHQMHVDHTYPSDEEHSVLEDDSDGEDRDLDYMDDDDGSSSLSIPNESIDFDLVYALHSFAATVEGQANVVKGDSLFLMDDSNSYWWLVRVLKTQEVGYIPAENIETPFERLARLNKHRNVDLASATQAELQESRDRLYSSRTGSNQAHTPSPIPGRQPSQNSRRIHFKHSYGVHRYAPAIWNEDEEEDEDAEWDDEDYEDEDPELAEEWEERERAARGGEQGASQPSGPEPDDGMSWEDGAAEEMQRERQQPQQPLPPAQIQIDDKLRQQGGPPQGAVQPLRTQAARDKLVIMQDEAAPSSPSSPGRTMDPAQATETRKLSVTPPVARSAEYEPPAQGGPLLPSAIMQQQSEERKRTREEIEALEEAARKKVNLNAGRPANGAAQAKVTSTVTVSDSGSTGKSSSGKLRKERDRGNDTTDDEGGKDKDKKKKSGGVFGGLFGRKKDKDKDKGKDKSDTGSAVSVESLTRESEESGRSRSSPLTSPEASSPVTTNARQQQQQAMIMQQKNSTDPKRPLQSVLIPPQPETQSPQTSPSQENPTGQIQLSQHVSQLRQRDQQQQALYQQYLNRSPATPPEAQPSYGLQSASAVLQGSMSFASSTSSTSGLSVSGSRPRPGSLVLSPTSMDGQGVGLPDLSVVRVFAGDHLQTEATFKTVLLNNSTTASDLVRQAIQRFRLPAGEDEKEYYLTIKQVEGSSAVLRPEEKPLGVFESLVEAALELPKVKRSSVGSISSVASNLSMHPAIKKLSMNDFTDDSQVKFYLNRRSRADDSIGDEGDDTLLAESVDGDTESTRGRGHFLSVSTSGGNTVPPERFSSPSFRFGLQLVIYPDDLPDDMVFDPQTEAIVFKNTLRNRPQASQVPSPGISQNFRKKIFVFPKNITVAEVIEQGLDRFGIPEGVVDGGDEIEDKQTKRRSSSRVRYGLAVEVNGKERELAPSSKVIDAFPRPPAYRQVDRRFSDSKRRSIDSAQLLLGSLDDVRPDDPIFILRRAVAYRNSSARHRSSAPLDELALQQLRESVASSSTASDTTAHEEPKRQMSKQELIAAQRAATRANQRAILSAQANSARGLDVLLPSNAMIRSSRYDVDDRMRYSYVEPDGETYDISDIVEKEWRNEVGPSGHKSSSSGDNLDLLHGVLAHGKDGLGAKLDRVLSKIKHEKETGRAPVSQASSDQGFGSARSSTDSAYPASETAQEVSSSRTATPTARDAARSNSAAATSQRVGSPAVSRLSSYRTASPGESDMSRAPTATPTSGSRIRGYPAPHERQASFASAVSDYRTATPSSPLPLGGMAAIPARKDDRPKLVLPRNDFGLNEMMAVIEMRASLNNKIPEHQPLDSVEEMLFGKPIEPHTLHPDIRDVYASTFKQLEEMDQTLDELLQQAIHVH